MECVRLRVNDVDFERAEIVVRDGKGAKDRVNMLPQSLIPPLQDHLRWRRQLYLDDQTGGRRYICRMRSTGNIRMRPVSGPGSTSFQPWAIRSIRAVARSAAIISTRRRCSGQ
ncbi:hypothetical protein ACLIKD_04420 [Azonexus sp. IMCC34842]